MVPGLAHMQLPQMAAIDDPNNNNPNFGDFNNDPNNNNPNFVDFNNDPNNNAMHPVVEELLTARKYP